jgi:GT2 family glycosyltransferase
VIVPHYSDLGRLSLCLAALGRQTLPAADFEIVVADNNSPEGEAAVRAVVGDRARLVIVTEKGAGPARNGGVAAAEGEILAFTDCDCVPEPNWLAEGVAALDRLDFVGGQVKVLVGDERAMTAAEAFERVFAFDVESYVDRKGFAVTANLFCRRQMFEAVGGFRVSVSEDVEWSWRARSLGYRLGYVPAASVGHPARRDWPELKAKWLRINRETFGLFLARRQGRLKWALRTCLLPASAVAHTLKVLLSGELRTFHQRWQALTMLYRLRLWRTGDAIRLLFEDLSSNRLDRRVERQPPVSEATPGPSG